MKATIATENNNAALLKVGSDHLGLFFGTGLGREVLRHNLATATLGMTSGYFLCVFGRKTAGKYGLPIERGSDCFAFVGFRDSQIAKTIFDIEQHGYEPTAKRQLLATALLNHLASTALSRVVDVQVPMPTDRSHRSQRALPMWQ